MKSSPSPRQAGQAPSHAQGRAKTNNPRGWEGVFGLPQLWLGKRRQVVGAKVAGNGPSVPRFLGRPLPLVLLHRRLRSGGDREFWDPLLFVHGRFFFHIRRLVLLWLSFGLGLGLAAPLLGGLRFRGRSTARHGLDICLRRLVLHPLNVYFFACFLGILRCPGEFLGFLQNHAKNKKGAPSL